MKKGFTLIELLFVVAIVAIFVSVIFSLADNIKTSNDILKDKDHIERKILP